jgi:hypothetical protein
MYFVPVADCKLLVTANVVCSALSLSTLMMEAICFSETSVLSRASRRHNPEDDILHSHRRENLKSYLKNHYLYFHLDRTSLTI